jgi:Cu2+-exporting ATPase
VPHSRAAHAGHGGHAHHAHTVADFRRRFWISRVLTVPILAISPGLWALFGPAPPAAQPLWFERRDCAVSSCSRST